MSVHAAVLAALSPILDNIWLRELPREPTWPAAVFDIDTVPEDGWCQGVTYERHTVSVVVLADDADALVQVIVPQMRASAEAMDGFMQVEGEGDAAYEGDAQVYGRYINFEIRSRSF